MVLQYMATNMTKCPLDLYWMILLQNTQINLLSLLKHVKVNHLIFVKKIISFNLLQFKDKGHLHEIYYMQKHNIYFLYAGSTRNFAFTESHTVGQGSEHSN